MELSKEEIRNTLVFLNRANITGNEATALALLLQKYADELKPKPLRAPAPEKS